MQSSFKTFLAILRNGSHPLLNVLINDVAKLKFKIVLIHLLDLKVAEVDLVSHVKKRALSQFKVVHSLGALSCENNDSEAVGEGPIKQ
jgi:hypothetical protein